MTILTVTGQRWSRAGEVARSAADALGYRFVDEAVFAEAAHSYQVTEERLRRALLDPPALIGVSRANRHRCLAYLQAELAAALVADDAVYHGPLGHLLLPGVAHLLRVSIVADPADRLALARARDQLPPSRARRLMAREERRRAWWATELRNRPLDGTRDFDLVLDTSQQPLPQAADALVRAARQPRFRSTTYSRQYLAQLAFEARIRAALVEVDPEVRVVTEQGRVTVHTVARASLAARRVDQIKRRASRVEGVTTVQVEVLPDGLSEMAGSMR